MTFSSTFPIIPGYHASVAFPSHHYQHPYYSDTTDSESYYRQHPTGIPSAVPPSQRRLTDERLTCDKSLDWSIDWATAFLVDHLSAANSPEAPDTLKKIARGASQLVQEGQWKQVAYRAFHTLNKTLFAEHLKDAVFLSFGRLGPDVSGATYTHGQGPNRRVRRISIVLNTDALQGIGGPALVSALIHHMVHAYFLVACGPQQEKEEAYGRLGHGMPFSKVLMSIKELARSRGRPCLPGLGPGHVFLKHHHEGYYRRPSRHHSHKEWYSSHCAPEKQPLSPGDVDEWYNGVCKPLLELPDAVKKSTVFILNKQNELEEVRRAETTASADSVEFILEEKQAILVPAAKLDPYLSVKRVFEKKGRYLAVPEEVGKEAFMAILAFLHTGTYGADLAPVTAAGRSGPPVIKPVRPSSPAYLMLDIAVFKASVVMNFDDIIGAALGRLRAQYITHEDPVTVLEAVYEGGDPHPELRAWAKEFLVRAPGMGDLEWGIARTGPMEQEPPNLMKLKCELCFRERFAGLLGRSSALHIDVLKAEESLSGLGMGLGVGVGVGVGRVSPVRNVIAGVGPYGVPIASPMSPSLGYGLGPPLGASLGAGLGPPVRGGFGWEEFQDEGYGRFDDFGARGVGIGYGERFEGWGY